MEYIELEGIIVDIDYASIEERSIIRITFKSNGRIYKLLDPGFYPYFFLNPFNQNFDASTIKGMNIIDNGERVGIHDAVKTSLSVAGKGSTMIAVYASNTRSIPKLSEHFSEFGSRYEYDILFWKRYL